MYLIKDSFVEKMWCPLKNELKENSASQNLRSRASEDKKAIQLGTKVSTSWIRHQGVGRGVGQGYKGKAWETSMCFQLPGMPLTEAGTSFPATSRLLLEVNPTACPSDGEVQTLTRSPWAHCKIFRRVIFRFAMWWVVN